MKNYPIDTTTYIANDPVKTLEVLNNSTSPIQSYHSGHPIFFKPKEWGQCHEKKQPPLITYSRPDSGLLYLLGDNDLEIQVMKEMNLKPQSKFDFTCEGIAMTKEERILLTDITKHLIANEQFFFMIGWANTDQESPFFIGGYNPTTKEIYSQISNQTLVEGRNL